MSRQQKIFLVAAAAFAISIVLDHLIAGNLPDSTPVTKVSRILSFIGDGFFLMTVCALIYAAGLYFKDADLKGCGRAGFLSVALSGVLVHILKASFERPRIAHALTPVVKLLENPSLFDLHGKYNSFPSGHATVSFALAYVLAKRYPNLRVVFYGMALLVALSRVYLHSHYPSDVTAGAILGVSAAWLVTGAAGSRKKWLEAGLIVLIISMSFFKIGGYLLFDVDEAVFSEASREMVETGDIITPTYNYEPRYDKPVLIYWLMALSFKAFGTSEFAARFPSALFGSLLVIMTFFFMRRVKGEAAGIMPMEAFFTSLALLLNIEYFVYTHSAVTDATLAFFIAASVYSFYLAIKEDNPAWFTAFWVFSALGVLTKGAVGLVFPLGIAFFHLALSGQAGKFKTIFKPAGMALFLIISVPWFAAEFYVNGWEFFNAFILKHHVMRYAGVVSGHRGPVYYYVIILLIGFFPWVGLLPGAIYRGFKQRLNQDSSLYVLAAAWFTFVFVFFSVARTKLPNYIFPLFPAAAIMAGLAATELIERKETAGKKGLYVMLALSAVFATALFIFPFTGVKMPVALPYGFFFITGAIMLIAAFFSITAFHHPLTSFLGISAVAATLLVFLRLAALPPVNIHLQKTLYTYSTYARDLKSEDTLGTYGINKPSIAFYAGRKTVNMDKRVFETGGIGDYEKQGRLLIITSEKRHEDLKKFEELKVIDAQDGYMLLGWGEGLKPFK